MFAPCSSVLLHESYAGHDQAHCPVCSKSVERRGLPLTFSSAVRDYSRDGRIYSICRICLATIAVAQSDLDLNAPEATHVCHPADLVYSGHSPCLINSASVIRHAQN